MTPAANPEQKRSRKKRKWLKRIGWVLACFLLIFILFHQPILMGLVRYGVPRLAAAQNLKLQFKVDGNALSDLHITDLSISPTGRSPVEKIDIGKIDVTYSFMDLLRHGRLNFVKSVDAKNATLVFKDPGDSPTVKKARANASNLGKDMQTWFFPPITFMRRATVENLNITNHSDDGNDFTLQGGSVSFERQKPGFLKVERMKIPNLREWEHIEGSLMVTDSGMVIQDLKISPDITLKKVISIPAEKSGQISKISLQADIFGGQLTADYATVKHGSKFDSKFAAFVTHFGVGGLGNFLESAVPLGGSIDRIEATCIGEPGVPSSWKGNVSATLTTLAGISVFHADHSVTQIAFDKGPLTIDSIFSSGTANKITAQATGQMPAQMRDFSGMNLDGKFQVAATDLSQTLDKISHGSLAAEGTFHLHSRELKSDVLAIGKEINSEKFDVAQIDLKGDLTRQLGIKTHTEFFDEIAGHANIQFKDLRMDKYALDSGTVTAQSKGGCVKVNATDLKRDKNLASFNGNCHLPRDLSKITGADFDVNFSVSAPNATAYNAETNLNGINGQLEANGGLSHHNQMFNGKIDIAGGKLAYGEFNAESLNAGIVIENDLVDLRHFLLVMDAKNRATGTGNVNLNKPYSYQGKLQANIADLSAFNPILEAAGVKNKIGGTLAIDWEGNGVIEEIHHAGSGDIKLTGGKYGSFQPITAEISGKYSPEAVAIPTIHVHVDKTDFVGKIDLLDTELKIHDILLQQEKITLLRGEILLPLDLRTPTNPDSLIPPTGRIFANLSTDEINLDTLLIRPKQTSPLKGMLKVSINADGSLDSLPANILLRARNLQVKAVTGVAPGNLELNADLKDNQLMLHGSLVQPSISPLQINGKLPFSLKQLLRDKRLDEKSPVELSVKLDKSPVAILRQLEPHIRYIEGQMGIDVKVGGTIAKPEFSGAATFDMPAIRMNDPTAPAVNGFKGNLDFAGNQLTFHRFGGEISGGPFDLTGKVVFEKLTEPVLDLRFTSQNLLVLRNETLTVRADSDVKIAGVFNAAHVTGNVGLTKSKFFREVEILPIELPGRPAPKPASELETGFSLKPPFSKWTFDVAIKSKDPFLVRGNLANGAVAVDIKLVGTGASPALDGLMRIDNFVGSLPFSRLRIEYGYVYFTPDNPFVPTLDIQGVSTLRDYNIHVYISGTPAEPVTIFSSDPPLPQEEIIALLGTGATSEELTSNSEVLAGRAAVLVLQKYYRKIFNRKPKPQENESFFSRFQLDPGAVDPRTGRQEVSAQFKATDRIHLVGDLDAQGGLRAQIRYLWRFR